jgi:pimeloyl-ACP methyl ester carboxylesterase
LRWHIYALDLRGHGRSGRVPGKYLPQDYSADVLAFLQDQLHDTVVILGLSAGGLAALDAAAHLPEKIRALLIGDSPLDMAALQTSMSTEGSISHFAAIQDLAGSGFAVAEIAAALGDLPAQLPGQEKIIKQRDLPGETSTGLLAWAKNISQLDPDVLAYHATGRGEEFLRNVDMAKIVQNITCPVLLLRGNPDLGAVMSPEAAEHLLSVLPHAIEVEIAHAGHDLGLHSWEAAPLLRAVINFLEAL